MPAPGSTKTPAQRLLDALGDVEGLHGDDPHLGDFGSPARVSTEDFLAPHAQGGEISRLGPALVSLAAGAAR